MALEITPAGNFGQKLAHVLDAKGLGIRDLAAQTESTYEHIRKLVKSIAYPSKHLLKSICHVLKLDYNEMDRLIVEDKMEHKLGRNYHVVLGRDPRLEEYSSLVPYLTDEQHQMFLTQMKAVAAGNRKDSAVKAKLGKEKLERAKRRV